MFNILYLIGKSQRIQWLKYTKWHSEDAAIILVLDRKPEGKILKRRPWKRCIDRVEKYLKELGIQN